MSVASITVPSFGHDAVERSFLRAVATALALDSSDCCIRMIIKEILVFARACRSPYKNSIIGKKEKRISKIKKRVGMNIPDPMRRDAVV
jgi:hypothetical protein